MHWYYADGTEHRGPVSEAEIASLAKAGRITEQTLVWNSGMKDWQPAASTALQGTITTAASDATAVCVMTGKSLPTSQMLRTEHGWVSGEARDTYYQTLREGLPLPMAGLPINGFADKKRIVVPAQGARLPRRCFKTNEAVTEAA